MDKKPFERPYIKRLSAGMPSKFGMPTHVDPITHIDEMPVEELIKKYGSPLFVISENTIRETIADAKRSFSTRYPRIQFAWSYKTNYLDAVCRIFHQEGSWAEVVSRFEYDKALHNGVKGSQIIFNGPDKTDDDLLTAVQNDSLGRIEAALESRNLNDIQNIMDACIAYASTFDLLKRTITSEVTAITESGQDILRDGYFDSLRPYFNKLSDDELNERRIKIERTKEGRKVAKTNPSRRLYVVAQPNKAENIERILAVLKVKSVEYVAKYHSKLVNELEAHPGR